MLITTNQIPNLKINKKATNTSFVGNKTHTTSSNNTFAKLTAENLKAYNLVSFGKIEKKRVSKDIIPHTFHIKGDNIDDYAETIKGKQFQGTGLFDEGFIDWSKVGWENLSQEPLNWETAKDDDFFTFFHALALAETKDSVWVRRYNETNVPEPLATYHTLVSTDAKADLKDKLELLNLIDAGKVDKYGTPDYLNKPLINPETKKFNLEFTVFDTETTGNRTNPKKGPVDKIIQIGAVKVGSDGEVKVNTAVSQFVNPEMPIHPKAVEVHHITDEMVADKPVAESVIKPFCEKYLQDQLIVAYNGKFDMPMLNRAVESYNTQSAHPVTDKPRALNMDPFIILQRIHPFIGASKKLGEQYKFIFGRTMEGAHDALDDVKGTVDVLKYCCYYLQKHCDRPLTVKDVLTFQHGGKVEGLDIKLNHRGYDASKDFRSSYRKDALPVTNFSDGWRITEPNGGRSKNDRPVISELKPFIGEENAEKLFELRNKTYKTRKGMYENLISMDLKPYNGHSVQEIIDAIFEKSVNILNYKTVKVWRKNIQTKDLHMGNDMPDIDIARNVMKERKLQDAEAKESGTGGRPLAEVLKDIEAGKA